MRKYSKLATLLLAIAALTLLASACTDDSGNDDGANNASNNAANNNANNNGSAGEVLASNKQRITAPDASASELETLTHDNRAFALDLYQIIRAQDGNLFYSPHSISIALAMTYGGARGQTATQMADALHFTLEGERLHNGFNALDLALASRGQNVQLEEGEEGDPFRLSVVNAIWGQQGYGFLDAYLDLIALNYGAGLRILDFMADPEGSREIINTWVEDQTEDRIKDLLPEGSIGSDTRLVLTNAVYFKASWLTPFEPSLTQPADFTRADGTTAADIPFMHQEESLAYSAGDGYQAVELPYVGRELSMVVLLPDAGNLDAFEAGLDVDALDAILADLSHTQVALALPKFTFEYDLPLNQPLMDLGMTDAFSNADFSGIDGSQSLVITDVLHKAFVGVDEKGTEAAAATAVVVGETSLPPDPIQFTADRPFLFLIRDVQTGAIIFIGRVSDPS